MRTPVNLADWQAAARRRLPRFVYDYVAQGAEDLDCLRRNRAAFDQVQLWPRVLQPTVEIDTSVELFGRRWPGPVGIAPTGMNGLVRPGGDLDLARAAEARGAVMCLSSAANASMEQVREAAPRCALWLQLYVLSDRSVAEGMMRRAKNTGVEALVLTVDVPVSGKREADLRHGFTLPWKIRSSMLMDLALHPGWCIGQALGAPLRMENLAPGGSAPASAQAALLSRGMDRSLSWDAIAWIRRFWDGPLVLKGLLHQGDAKRCLDYGVDAIIVSNHGGRQLDIAPASLDALPGVVNQIAQRIPVLLDSGIRRGSDIARALALGADAVMVGRAPLFGLAAAGQGGVLAVLDLLDDELRRTLCLLGISELRALRLAVES
jgi:(S)-mandelate dehydrogenase